MLECVYEENTIVSMHMCFPYLTFFDVSAYFKYMNHVINDFVLGFFRRILQFSPLLSTGLSSLSHTMAEKWR